MLNHDTFYNRERIGYDELMSYYPKYWKDIREMCVNNKFAGYTLDRAAKDMEQVIFDQFFETCSRDVLVRCENFLGLSNSDKGWEERRKLLKMAWNWDLRMNRTKIKAIIQEYSGFDCNVRLTDTQLVIDMIFYDNPVLYMPNIRKFINTSTIPAHVEITYKGIAELIEIVWKGIAGIQSMECKMDFALDHVEDDHLECAIDNNLAVEQTENYTADVTIKKNLHYLDGSLLLDGSTLLNSYIKKEVL